MRLPNLLIVSLQTNRIVLSGNLWTIVGRMNEVMFSLHAHLGNICVMSFEMKNSTSESASGCLYIFQALLNGSDKEICMHTDLSDENKRRLIFTCFTNNFYRLKAHPKA